MPLDRAKFERACDRVVLALAYAGIAFVAGIFSILWGVV